MNTKQELIRISKLLEEKGFTNAFQGNISIIDRNLGKLFITPSGTRKLTLTEEEVAVLDMDGKQLEGSVKKSSEYKMHLAALKYRQDCTAVIHCHSVYLTAFSMLGETVNPKCHEEFLLTRGIPCLPWGKGGTSDIYKGLEEQIKYHDIVLLGNHGALCVGSDLEKAFKVLEAVDNTLRAWVLAMQIGNGKVVDIPIWDELIEQKEKAIHNL
ncbi:class II aldolase/adducin family protein [uncultured Anaerofustis sp.]|uniref:class II aldolase/adducin family protein n=1 Tax=uncultured Anaerofustis sp. TaxID=904996 RepID=UPI0025D9629D|nr:class II aldolase/adducin family protein [uncultured Anaerofustis sp.]